jgi:hypothetical protein
MDLIPNISFSHLYNGTLQTESFKSGQPAILPVALPGTGMGVAAEQPHSFGPWNLCIPNYTQIALPPSNTSVNSSTGPEPENRALSAKLTSLFGKCETVEETDMRLRSAESPERRPACGMAFRKYRAIEMTEFARKT